MPSYVHQLEKSELDRLYLSLDNFLVRSDLIIRLKNIDGTNTLGKDFFPPSGVMRCSMQNWPSKMGFFFNKILATSVLSCLCKHQTISLLYGL